MRFFSNPLSVLLYAINVTSTLNIIPVSCFTPHNYALMIIIILLSFDYVCLISFAFDFDVLVYCDFPLMQVLIACIISPSSLRHAAVFLSMYSLWSFCFNSIFLFCRYVCYYWFLPIDSILVSVFLISLCVCICKILSYASHAHDCVLSMSLSVPVRMSVYVWKYVQCLLACFRT